MNKLLPLIIVVVALGAGMYALKGGSSTTPPDSSVKESPTDSPTSTINTSLAKLIASGSPVQCSVETEENGMKTKGTVYVAGKKIRGDFKTDTPDQGVVDSHLLINDDAVHVWASSAPQGIRLPLESAESGAVQGIDYTKEKDYGCRSWTPDNSKFQLPSDVKFSDLGSLIQKTGTAR